MAEKNDTKCDQKAMVDYWFMLKDIIANLNEAYEKADTLLGRFDEGYEGDAREEVEIFLTSLPLHIYRLALFYTKMMEFTSMTAESLFQNDAEMAAGMER